tara:strand:+ start:12535 stop:12843 length:309 start_codon:yes stop_codon:yes gene_type:complete
MEIEITKTIKQKVKVSVDLPFYYKHDLMLDELDAVIFGKIEEGKSTAIKVTKSYRIDSKEFELEIVRCGPERYSCYLTEEYKCSESEYIEAKEQLLKAAKDA